MLPEAVQNLVAEVLFLHGRIEGLEEALAAERALADELAEAAHHLAATAGNIYIPETREWSQVVRDRQHMAAALARHRAARQPNTTGEIR